MKDRILTIRKTSKLNQDDFAKKLNLTKNYISLIETGNRVPSDRTISDICRAFSINEEWLRNGTGEMKKNTNIEFGEICREIGISDEKAKQAIMDYWKLSEEDKKLFWDFAERFLK